jgi:hypothetical protein
MWEPTADDLDDLLAQYRDAGDTSPRTPTQPAEPGNLPESGTAAKAGAPQQSRAARPAASRKKAAGKSAPVAPPSQVIFGRQIRDQSDIEDYEIPPEYRIDPARLHVDSLVVERLADVQAREVDWLWPGRIPLGRVTLLAAGPRLAREIHQEARGCGLSKSTVHRAARRLGVTIDRKGYSQAHCSKWLLNLSTAVETAPP